MTPPLIRPPGPTSGEKGVEAGSREAAGEGMTILRRLLLLAGLAAFAILLWKLDLRVVLQTVSRAGIGIFFVLLLEAGTVTLNAIGWRLSFESHAGREYGIGELARLWLAMDGINYFVPTGTIAGEIARASMLRDIHPLEVRTASVVISRIAQTIAQITFVLAGFTFLVSQLRSIRRFGWIGPVSRWALIAITIVMIVYAVVVWIRSPVRAEKPAGAPALHRFFGRLGTYFAVHPWRFLSAVLVFMAGYLWPCVEAWWICRLIGVPVPVATAITIEILSVAIDGALFLVPAKVGTQELGKTAIFSLLGLPLSAGAAFGIIRHVREIAWNLGGLAIYSRHGTRPERALL